MAQGRLADVEADIQNLALVYLSVEIVQAVKLRRLTCLPRPLYLLGIPATDDVFAHLTHLHLAEFFLYCQNDFDFAALPVLSHLCITDSRDEHRAVLKGILKRSSTIRVLVCTFHSLVPADPWVNEPRAVTMVCKSVAENLAVGAAGGRDIWARADEFLDKKKNNPTVGS